MLCKSKGAKDVSKGLPTAPHPQGPYLLVASYDMQGKEGKEIMVAILFTSRNSITEEKENHCEERTGVEEEILKRLCELTPSRLAW